MIKKRSLKKPRNLKALVWASGQSKPEGIKPGIYRHYKGQQYEVIALAHHSETEEPLVIYKALYKTKFGNDSWWVRPYTMFVERIVANGKKMPRFKFINKAEHDFKRREK